MLRAERGNEWSNRKGGRGRLWLLMACLLLAGCTKSEPPHFRLNMFQMVTSDISRPRQQEIADMLGAMFGTPNEPFALSETGLDLKKLAQAAGPVTSDVHGDREGLFRRHCVHCHGITGDGLGPTAVFLNPYPRDYRQGKFKFKSTQRANKPTREDLRRIIVEGVPGTAMPSFQLLPEREIEALVEYVIYLSMRGEMETLLADYCFNELDDEDRLADVDRGELVDNLLVARVVQPWSAAKSAVIHPDPQTAPPPDAERQHGELAASVAAGRELYYGKKANCFTCHGPSALGDGQTTDYDDWNKPLAEMAQSLEPPDSGASDYERDLAVYEAKRQLLAESLPPRTIRPRNLRGGVYRGGRRPLDLYRRVYAGINGAPMPGVAPPTLTPEEIWHLVDYVRSLPYEPASLPPKSSPTIQRERM